MEKGSPETSQEMTLQVWDTGKYGWPLSLSWQDSVCYLSTNSLPPGFDYVNRHYLSALLGCEQRLIT